MILEVSMTNWRAFDQDSFKFKPGLNFIMGPNGKGKTSILEAIVYGLTGELSVVEDRNQLLRDPNKPAIISLTFKVDGTTFRIDRTQRPGKTGEASIWDLKTNHRLAVNPQNVTEKVEELLGVSADFFKRIVYMAEGDLFRFLQNPPGKAMNEQLQRVLGLTQIEQFREGIRFAQRDLREKTQWLRDLRQRMLELSLWGDQELDIKLAELDSKRELYMKEIFKLQEQLTLLNKEYITFNRLMGQIQQHISLLRANAEIWERINRYPFYFIYDELQKETKRNRELNLELEKTLARLNGQKEVQTHVLELLSGTNYQPEVFPCPVCKNPMTSKERRQVVEDVENELSEIEPQIAELKHLIQDATEKNYKTKSFLEGLQEIRNNLIYNPHLDIPPSMSLLEIMNHISDMRVDPEGITKRISLLKEQLEELVNIQTNYLSIQIQLHSKGLSGPKDLHEAMIQIESRQMVLKAAYKALEETLSDLRDLNLIPIYEQIASIWNNFTNKGKVKLRFDQQGKPILQVESDREFQFSQFSGGEKTALLVMIHTIIAHHFSHCKFLIVDEPLEHLDPVNRRSLMRFFVAASQNNIFDQALITTYEESLVRKFISEADVNIIHIQ